MQVLMFTALWLLADLRTYRRPRVALVVGVLLGMLQAARIDALAVLTGLGVLFAVIWLVAGAADRRSVAVSSGLCAIGLVPGVVLGFTDLSLRSQPYLHDLRTDVKELGAAMVASIVVGLVLVVVVPRIARRVTRIPRGTGWIAAALVALVGFSAWFLRPRLQHVRGPGTA